MNTRSLWAVSALLAAGIICGCTLLSGERTHTFALGENDFLLDGKPFIIRCGEIHAPRVPPEYWSHRLKMCKALGLNTVCAYMFWNLHEPQPGVFNFSGEADVAAFCRAAQKEGLWVILRPGPYACAEWEFGGLPWWLLKEEGIKLRSTDPKFLEPAKRYLREVARQLKDQQVTHGGPILMVQVENEYGFWGGDDKYLPELRKTMLEAGFDVPLFACNPSGCLKNGADPALFAVANFGGNPTNEFKRLRAFQPKGPLMCGEFYPAWFDSWGSGHHVKDPNKMLKDLEAMLQMNASFSIYMAHGGTSFGFWSGCNDPFQPQTSSYDYDAPISEAGWTTRKFDLVRALFGRYLNPGETLGEIPAKNPIISFSAPARAATAALRENLPAPVENETPLTFEELNLGYGSVLYRTTLPADCGGTLKADARDLGVVLVDGTFAGYLDRRRAKRGVSIAAAPRARTLDIVIDHMGRSNFGRGMHNAFKGIKGAVTIGSIALKGWKHYRFAFDAPMFDSLTWRAPTDLADGTQDDFCVLRKFSIDIPKPGDTFLDVRGMKRGMVWVNGHNLGRYWGIGPTQTMYVPGCWLKPGANELIIWESGSTAWKGRTLCGLKEPILDELHPELNFITGESRTKITPNFTKPILSGQFKKGYDTVTEKFAAPVKGRYLAVRALNSWTGEKYAAIAEFDALGADGLPIDKSQWSIAGVDSEELDAEDGSAENSIDGQIVVFWHTQWRNAKPDFPHWIVFDLGKETDVYGFKYVPRQGLPAGSIKDYEIYIGDDIVK